MSIGFFIIGGVIFAVYLYLMFWNIVYSSKKQRQENYPNVPAKEETKLDKILEATFTRAEKDKELET